MSYKLIAVDIDGTLTDSGGNLTEATKASIKAAVDKGIIFIISTGRPIQGVEYINQMLDLNVPYITYNGAMVVMGQSKEILYEQGLSPIDARAVIELGKKYNVTMIVWSNNRLYISEFNDRTNAYMKMVHAEPIVVHDYEELILSGITKVLWYDDAERIEYYQVVVGEFLGSSVNYHISRPIFLEFVDKNASKAIALEKIGEYYGIKPSEMITVGDSMNDLSMIEYAGLGVAMGNAREAIKEKADYVTLSNDEDGVAHVIKKFILS